MIKVSILLPTYNGSAFIAKAIESVISQTCEDWELVIMDDASTDNTGAISLRYAKDDARIRYIRNAENIRLVNNLNKGISESRGSLIARIDEDDQWIDKDKLKNQIDYMSHHEDCSLIGTRFEIVNEHDERLRSIDSPSDDTHIRKIILSYNPFCHSSVMFKKVDAIKVGGYSSSIKYGEDYDLWLKLGKIGSLTILPSISVRYLQRVGSMSSTHTKWQQIIFHTRLIIRHRKNYPGLIIAIARLFYFTITS